MNTVIDFLQVDSIRIAYALRIAKKSDDYPSFHESFLNNTLQDDILFVMFHQHAHG